MKLLILVIGIFSSALTYAQDEIPVSEDGGSTHPGMVLVEPDNVVRTSVEGVYKLKPYKERRERWGGTVSLGYSSYEPINYEPDGAAVNFDEVYTSPDMPMIELAVGVKRNLAFGSVGGELSVGVYTNESDETTFGDSTLNLYPIRGGAAFFLDMISQEPTFVPYVAGGVYTIMYKESREGTSHNGNSQVAFYGNLGIQFSLDWIDREAARVAYESSGIQASYLFLEARTQTASSGKNDPDFGNSMAYAGGLRVEF